MVHRIWSHVTGKGLLTGGRSMWDKLRRILRFKWRIRGVVLYQDGWSMRSICDDIVQIFWMGTLGMANSIKRSHANLPTTEARHLLSPASAAINNAFHVSSFSTMYVHVHAYTPYRFWRVIDPCRSTPSDLRLKGREMIWYVVHK